MRFSLHEIKRTCTVRGELIDRDAEHPSHASGDNQVLGRRRIAFKDYAKSNKGDAMRLWLGSSGQRAYLGQSR
jgi:hypothetical protein